MSWNYYKRFIRFISAMALSFFLFLPVALGDVSQELAGVVNNADKKLAGTFSVSVRDLTVDKDVFNHNSDVDVIPASVAKIFTSVSVLSLLGPDFQVPTEIWVPARFNKPYKGDVYLRGYGDPSMVDEYLWVLARDLVAKGVVEVDDLYVDNSMFVDARGRLGERAYQAAESAVPLNFNSLAITVVPGNIGSRPLVFTNPVSGILLDNAAKTVQGSQTDLALEVNQTSSGTINVSLGGVIGREVAPKTHYRAIDTPGLYLGNALKRHLEFFGVAVRGVVAIKQVPSDAVMAHEAHSRLISEVLKGLNRYSNNFTAEQLAFLLGQDSLGRLSHERGVARVQTFVNRNIRGGARVRLVDASGLSRDNRTTTRALVGALDYAWNSFEIMPEFLSSLARFGGTGTLEKRLPGLVSEGSQIVTGLRAKTGTLTGVSSLAGYARSAEGHLLAFAIIYNGQASKALASDFEDRIIERMVRRSDVIGR